MMRTQRRTMMSIKASPTVQRLIRDAGLETWPTFATTGPKGTVSAEDVAAAVAAKAELDRAAAIPLTIPITPPTAYKFDGYPLATEAVTSRAELMRYYETMFTMRRMEIAADVLY